MSARHLVVDGSNIATEGRSIPSLAALESVVGELRREMPGTEVIVVVDATFAHRIEASERQRFEEAALRGEYVYPPAGAIGRGDAFLLRIAEKIGAAVLSNDSFQEFHGEHPWLFDTGRLLGATPVPGVGWIFVPRIPVRGPKSRIAVRDSKQSKGKVERAIAAATKEAVEPDKAQKASKAAKDRKQGRAKTGKGPAGHPDEHIGQRRSPTAVNEPLTFISFVADHPLGDLLEAEVDSFTSHGAIALVGEMRCYVPLSGLGEPAPRSAREVLKKGERRQFVLTALDPQRRGVELAFPEVAVVSGRPQPETVAAEVAMTKPKRTRRAKEAPRSEAVSTAGAKSATPAKKAAPASRATQAAATKAAPQAKAAPAKKVGTRQAAKKATPSPAAPPASTTRVTRTAKAAKAAKAAAQPASAKASAKATPPKETAAKAPAKALAKAPAKAAAVKAPAKAAPAKRGAAAKKAAPAKQVAKPDASTPASHARRTTRRSTHTP